MTRPEESLQQLLAQMRDEPVTDAFDENAEREERFAERIDDFVLRLPAPQKQKRPRRFGYLLLAACLSIGLVAIVFRQKPEFLAIEGEPISARRVAKPQPSEVPSLPSAQTRVGVQHPPSDTVEPRSSARPPRRDGNPSPKSPENVAPQASAELADDNAKGSTLSEENRLFQAASQAEQTGDVNAALSTFDKLIREFPRSPLAQNAMARKFRLLSRAGRKSEATAEAQRYLQAYPSGFAEREATTIVNGAGASGSTGSGEERTQGDSQRE